MRAVPIESAEFGDTFLRGRPSSSRAEWEIAREADAINLNRLVESGGEVAGYVVPLWSNADIERCLRELRGFDEARVFLEITPDEAMESALATIAEGEWAGAALRLEPLSPLEERGRGEGLTALAGFLYACAGLEIPIYVEDAPNALRALALALGEDLTPREIEAVLRGENAREPDAESLDHARDLLIA